VTARIAAVVLALGLLAGACGLIPLDEPDTRPVGIIVPEQTA
jgi:hypothetical protein